MFIFLDLLQGILYPIGLVTLVELNLKCWGIIRSSTLFSPIGVDVKLNYNVRGIVNFSTASS